MSEQNRHSFTLTITPPPSNGGDASAAPSSTLGSNDEGTPESAGRPLRLTLNVEVAGQDIIRVSAVDDRGRSYEGRLSLRPDADDDLCYICDANGCRWMSPCPEDSSGAD